MNMKDFETVVKTQMTLCEATLINKGKEYAADAYIEKDDGQLAFDIDAMTDRLHAFKKAAALMNTTPKAALLGMLSKHLVSVSDMCLDNRRHSIDKWNEKITDSICYLLILRAVVEEELFNEKYRNKNTQS